MGLELTEKESLYLKLIFREQFEESGEIKTTSIAEKFCVSPATVTERIQNMAEKGFLEHDPYSGVKLTEKGISKGQNLLRKHRLLEILFSEKLGHRRDEYCKEASKLDYKVSEELARSICRAYGHPERCPCDKKIYQDPGCKEEKN